MKTDKALAAEIFEALYTGFAVKWPNARVYKVELGTLMRHRHSEESEYYFGGVWLAARAKPGEVGAVVNELLLHFHSVVVDPVAIGMYPTAIGIAADRVVALAGFVERLVYDNHVSRCFSNQGSMVQPLDTGF